MKKKINQFPALSLAAVAMLAILNAQPSTAFAQGTAFSYQGRLNDGANPATGIYDLQFAIYDSTNGPGTLVAGPLVAAATTVSNGLFTVTLDFGAGAFTGANRWLDIAVRTNGTGTFFALTPRQPITPTPYAITAENLNGTVSASQVSGVVPLAQLPSMLVTNNETTVTLGNLTLNGNLNLPATTSGAGIIYAGGSPLIQSFGSGNFFAGPSAGNLTMSGSYNSAIGFVALQGNTSGGWNAALGAGALQNNTSGSWNVASGYRALTANTTGVNNTANGTEALENNTTGSENTASGMHALGSSMSGNQNTASGGWSLTSLTNGSYNTAYGDHALMGITSGFWNTASGESALQNITNGSYNTALGYNAGVNLTSGNYNIDIGNSGVDGDNGVIRIGTAGTHTTTLLAGNVGIGTNSPQALLHIAGTAGDLRMRSENVNPLGTSILDLAVPGGTAELLEAGTNYPFWGGPFSLNLINVGGTGPLTFNHFLNGSPVEHMRITSTGNVGIGTSSPSKPLEVDAAGDAEIGLRSTDANGHLWTVQSSAVEGDADLDATFQIIDRTLSVSRLLIATNGNVGIGKTSPATALDVNGTVTATSFSGSGAGLTGINASQFNAWQIGGNTGTTPGVNFLGTIDNQPLEFWVGGHRAFRLEPEQVEGLPYLGAPNVVGGSAGNGVGFYVRGATISGGGEVSGAFHTNYVGSSFGTVGGGFGNAISDSADAAAIGGGQQNTIASGAKWSLIAGGNNNQVYPYSTKCAIGGGDGNFIFDSGRWCAIAGGYQNRIWTNVSQCVIAGGGVNQVFSGPYATIGGGAFNSIGQNSGLSDNSAVIAGGFNNIIGNWSDYGVISGGRSNLISGGATCAFVGGGWNNTATAHCSTIVGGCFNAASGAGAVVAGGGYDGANIVGNTAGGASSAVVGGTANIASGSRSTVGGGHNNSATNFYATVPGGAWNIAGGAGSFAAGRAAKIAYDGCFVWNDDNGGDFVATAQNQFLIHADGGVGIGTASPDAKLSVNGTADKPGGGSWNTFSDARLKDVGEKFTHGLADLAGIQPVHYHYKADNPLMLPSQPDYVGVVAQQVERAVPEAVERNKDGYLVVNNDPIIWTMLNAIKELNQKEAEQLKAKDAEIQDLKQSVAELKTLVEKLAGK